MAGKKQSYETMLKKLEAIVDKMENDQLTLEERMKNYEEGMKLSNNLSKILNTMEGKISILQDGKEEEF
ncbi:exodeoxyribonuclease VII small subunit [Hathewaya limosa]|uniref:Exodeoxyribonuclease 7 small subunit n=1 Tax=Hathewaya limosa TaxID=1536 RepID=A0ABU0JUS0_HATLI|nr:exodeoxyribonuclease VII small subunit [Hathewaya limosa]AWZ48268.1 exodeoxyribonuclease VII small subunit [Clostridiaceae bacterium 14S0207]MDQ0479799.1 exodeoxyribonuclease VII small subunit [Hathewaya limosa]